ncbi:hypothetical protein HELRODRAFT_179833 [Helobdella robusta]|uniref:MARVEL domain-containing protein n=1 Tax=Helobdella robusta TaxID=6412 RepID=T1FF71_HELRO|nr:hypothetical protein HELRODRAFT_179833 [Helobdella robusta]ESN94989.1 hypothetical protein HELRODRAFT_179833 [Helobdella robusta]
MGMNANFVGTVQGLLKGYFWYYSVGWVIFSGVIGCIVALTFFILYFFGIYPEILSRFKLEVIVNLAMAVFLFIAGVVAGVATSKTFYVNTYNCAAAASFFAFVSMVLFIVDAVLLFFNQIHEPQQTTTTTTTSSTTHTNPPSDFSSPNAVY